LRTTSKLPRGLELGPGVHYYFFALLVLLRSSLLKHATLYITPIFCAALAPSLFSCFFLKPVSTPARLQLTIPYLSPSSAPHLYLSPSTSTPSFALFFHSASSSLISPHSMPSTTTTSTSLLLHCNHFTQLRFSDPTTTVLLQLADTNRNRVRAASSGGLTPI